MPNANNIKKANQSKPGFLTNLKNAANYVKDSTVVKIATGSGVGRAIGVVMVITAATVATIPATVIGLASIAIGTVMDTVQTRSLRLARKENLLLTKNRDAKDRQDSILRKEPLLANALDDILADNLAKNLKVSKTIPNLDDQSSPAKNTKNAAKQTISISAYGLAMIKNSISTVKDMLNVVANPSIINIAKVGKAAYGIYGESTNQATKEEIGFKFQQRINQEKRKSDTPVYDNLVELAVITKEQRVQALALQKLVDSGSFRIANPQKIRTLFEEARQEVLLTEKAIKDKSGIIGTIKSYVKDFARAHNPFSKYNNLDQLKHELRIADPQPSKSKNSHIKTQEISGIKASKLSKQAVIGKAKEFSKETLSKQPDTNATVHHRKQKKLLQSHSIK